ncbi:tRNA (adenosine(37)-N6)-threonylcarbamoyltransferase complex ATPase subunit type 1 TsaE [Nisaea sediminum]|uniref:tRNA (adenosine(37)-N6)-threonylcarbamoyltransferase complex ATPase subunit type 1 TsaE n=1 Tax=Nisaea sediminum TaxID=2775867 RepID=UPI0029C0C086|nr:tRNA (adenosine(37)-N6)-threonylcarbamoyltransferase complex ATPase subunit type 1 TsaE [Nisaea sediminum]
MTETHVAAGLHLEGQEQTESLAWICADLAGAGCSFLLSGGLGAGKSTFARAFIRYLVGEDEEVPSPTFTLVQQYGPIDKDGQEIEIWHADLYRIGDPDEVLELGLDEAFETAICLVEWPERLGDFAPLEAVALHFEICEGGPAEDGDRLVALSLPEHMQPGYADAFAEAGFEVVWTNE